MQIAVISFLGYNNSIIRNRRGRKKMGFIAVVIVFASLGYDMYRVIRSHGNNLDRNAECLMKHTF